MPTLVNEYNGLASLIELNRKLSATTLNFIQDGDNVITPINNIYGTENEYQSISELNQFTVSDYDTDLNLILKVEQLLHILPEWADLLALNELTKNLTVTAIYDSKDLNDLYTSLHFCNDKVLFVFSKDLQEANDLEIFVNSLKSKNTKSIVVLFVPNTSDTVESNRVIAWDFNKLTNFNKLILQQQQEELSLVERAATNLNLFNKFNQSHYKVIEADNAVSDNSLDFLISNQPNTFNLRFYPYIDQLQVFQQLTFNGSNSELKVYSLSIYQQLLPSIYESQLAIELQLVTRTNSTQLPPLNGNAKDDDDVVLPYLQLLKDLFKDRLLVINQFDNKGNDNDRSLNHGYGKLVEYIQQKNTYIKFLETSVLNSNLPLELANLSYKWLASRTNLKLSAQCQQQIQHHLEQLKADVNFEFTDVLCKVESGLEYLTKRSLWLIGTDAWCYDFNLSGLHTVVSSQFDINLLVLDHQSNLNNGQNKKDLALYGLNYQNFVATTAIYANYSQSVRSFVDADYHQGPATVLGYLPITKTSSSNRFDLQSLKVSKQAVDSGNWPLYRYYPTLASNKDSSRFVIDSGIIYKELQSYLDKGAQLSILSNQQLNFIKLEKGHQSKWQNQIRIKKFSTSSLLNNLSGPPLLILYSGDGTNAESVAKHLYKQALRRSFKAKVSILNEIDISELQEQPLVLFVVSTAGQGEFPVNGKLFWKSFKSYLTPLTDLKFAVFGLGDRDYWPRKEDYIYFNKPGKDLNAKLLQLKANQVCDLGLGDDQDEDGYNTKLVEFEEALWTNLNAVINPDLELDEEVKKTDDDAKIDSNYLRGNIAAGLLDTSTGALSEADTKLTKFHGIYQQDDRDLRDQRLEQGIEPAYSFMVRVRVPGGVATPQQYLKMEEIADQLANGGLKLTTRQAFQFHGVLKSNLKSTIQEINKGLLDTLAACGDVNRNVMLTINPNLSNLHGEIVKFSKDLSHHLSPQTSAYHEIWLQDKLVAGNAVQTKDYEPIYGPTYLPRKFKIAIAVPPYNDVDVFAHCLGFIAIVEDNQVIGYNVTVGGGMGMTHNNLKTFPRLADTMAFCTPQQAIQVAEKVLLVQRDFGDRTNRKHARLKYTINDRGINWFKNEVETRLGFKLEPPKQYKFEKNGDTYGWYKYIAGNGDQEDKWNCGLFMQNGRIKDELNKPWKSGLRKVAQLMDQHGGEFILTPNQNLILSNIPTSLKIQLQPVLEEYKLNQEPNFSQLRLNSMACVALPTCALAMAESERYLPSLIDLLEPYIYELGLEQMPITMRMTGCPNGCARPYVAEIALVGKAANSYNLYLGGGFKGQRLNKLFKASINEEEIVDILKDLFKRYKEEGYLQDNERFGDFCIRKGVINETLEGNDFHSNLAGIEV